MEFLQHARDEHDDESPSESGHGERQALPEDANTHAPGTPTSGRPHVELEPGWLAASALEHNNNDELLALMLRPSFRPARELDLVPVAPCPHCLDGGLRTAGTVRTRRGRQLVSACDTCGVVVLSMWLSWQTDLQARDG